MDTNSGDLYDQLLDTCVDNFLQWKLPANFYPDAGITFAPGHVVAGSPLWPVGTNLFTSAQAKEMFRACLPVVGEQFSDRCTIVEKGK